MLASRFWLTRPFAERSTQLFLAVLLAAMTLVTLLHVVVPQGHALHVNAYTVNLFGKYLSYALLALAVDLVWGYLGILSLGHGAFFALGGYAMGMYLMRQIGDRGVYGHPELPDFMVFLSWDSLPWYWAGFDMAWFAFLMVLLAPGALALVFGFLAFRSRVTGVYLSIITQAMTFALMLAFFRNEMGFGGNNGLTDFRDILGFNLRSNETRLGLFLATGVALALAYLLCRAIVGSKLGRVCVATRDAEARTRFLGYRVERFQLFVFVVSAMLAGLAGALYVPQVGIINPSEFSPLFSIEIVLWVALGGRATLYGAVIGAILVNYAKTVFTGVMPDAWLFALGALFVLVTVFLPRGVAGLLAYRFPGSRLRRRGADDDDVHPPTKEATA
ncbi:urea ABC transporter permease subunit UrtC [Halomonas sp. RA08-2]|uniref:urea ABC transporter permease subunit UrtC n=1 Tax=Halomonas sp. RA08-2 TaxID=3440842 RepID=UPI003EEBCCB9